MGEGQQLSLLAVLALQPPGSGWDKVSFSLHHRLPTSRSHISYPLPAYGKSDKPSSAAHGLGTSGHHLTSLGFPFFIKGDHSARLIRSSLQPPMMAFLFPRKAGAFSPQTPPPPSCLYWRFWLLLQASCGRELHPPRP